MPCPQAARLVHGAGVTQAGNKERGSNTDGHGGGGLALPRCLGTHGLSLSLDPSASWRGTLCPHFAPGLCLPGPLSPLHPLLHLCPFLPSFPLSHSLCSHLSLSP